MSATADPVVLDERGHACHASADLQARAIAALELLECSELDEPLSAKERCSATLMLERLRREERRNRALAAELLERAVALYRQLYGAAMFELSLRPTAAEALLERARDAARRAR